MSTETLREWINTLASINESEPHAISPDEVWDIISPTEEAIDPSASWDVHDEIGRDQTAVIAGYANEIISCIDNTISNKQSYQNGTVMRNVETLTRQGHMDAGKRLTVKVNLKTNRKENEFVMNNCGDTSIVFPWDIRYQVFDRVKSSYRESGWDEASITYREVLLKHFKADDVPSSGYQVSRD